MSFNPIRENKILAKISDFTVYDPDKDFSPRKNSKKEPAGVTVLVHNTYSPYGASNC